MFLQASLQQSYAINSVAYVSSAEQGHSSPSRGTFLEIIKLTESSFLHALCHLRLSAAVNITGAYKHSHLRQPPTLTRVLEPKLFFFSKLVTALCGPNIQYVILNE